MRHARCFLVVADDPERLMLISTTLHRKFPNSVVKTCRETKAALSAAKAHKLDAIIAHRSADTDEIPLWEQLRATSDAPIVAISNHRHAEAAQLAGASRFLHVEQWLLIGTVVADLLGARPE
jgi:DNA-binding response OmpR family regulator